MTNNPRPTYRDHFRRTNRQIRLGMDFEIQSSDDLYWEEKQDGPEQVNQANPPEASSGQDEDSDESPS